MNENILLIGNFDKLYLNFLTKKYINHKIYYWHQFEEEYKIDSINYYKFYDFNDDTICNFLKTFKIFYKLVLVSSLDYWDNIRIIRNISNNLTKDGIVIINDVIYTKEYYSREISLYGHDLSYSCIEFIKKSKLLFSNLAPIINNLFSSNDLSSIILLTKK